MSSRIVTGPEAISIEELFLYRDLLGHYLTGKKRAVLFGHPDKARKVLSAASKAQRKAIQSLVFEERSGEDWYGLPQVGLDSASGATDLIFVCSEGPELEWMEKARKWAGPGACCVPVDSAAVLMWGRGDETRDWPRQMFFLCSGQRTGSTLLASLLRETGLLGVPREQFREFLEERVDAGVLTYDDIIPRILKTFQSDNGVFGVKVHGHQYPIMQRAVRQLSEPVRLRFEESFQDARYVFLTRRDRLAQAISLWRARRTRVFHRFRPSRVRRLANGGRKVLAALRDIVGMGPVVSESLPEYDYKELKECLCVVIEERRVWLEAFSTREIDPLVLEYESFVQDLPGTVGAVASFLGVELSQNRSDIRAPSEKLADEYTLALRDRLAGELEQRDPELSDSLQEDL